MSIIPDIARHLIFLVYFPANGGHKLPGVGLAKGVEGVLLVHGEEGEPLLQHVVQVRPHVGLRLGQLVAERKACKNGANCWNFY